MRATCLGIMIVLAALPTICGCGKADTSASGSAGSRAATKPAATEPMDMVELEIKDYGGIMESVAKHRGEVVVMDAWSTQCEPCMKEFHNLVELQHKYPDRVACISLSFDYEGLGKPEDQRSKVLEFLHSQHADIENLLSSDSSDDLYSKFKLASIPAVFVYDRQGKLAKRFTDPFTYADVNRLVDELVGK